jgi:RNA polymerase sigma factor (sigma-70 family)
MGQSDSPVTTTALPTTLRAARTEFRIHARMDETPASPAGDRQAWDAELVRRIRAGDERALEVVFKAHYAGMASFVQRFVRSHDLAEEQGTDDDPPTTFAADEETVEQEVAVAVQAAINRLPPRCREIFLLSRDGGLTYAEIARSLEISVKTVETQMGRALKSLRASLHHFRE